MKDLGDCLNDCLERLASGQSLEECLDAYPEVAGELEPLLRQALPLLRGPYPSPQFRASLLRRLEAAGLAPRRRAWSFGAFLPSRRWAVALSLALALLLGGVGTAWASSSSVPGDLLYPVKMATERGRGVTTFTQKGRAERQVRLAGERAREMAALMERGRGRDLEKLQERLEAHLEKVEAAAFKVKMKERQGLRLKLEEEASRHLPRFRKAMERFPETQQAGLKPFLEKAEGRFQRAAEATNPTPKKTPRGEPPKPEG